MNSGHLLVLKNLSIIKSVRYWQVVSFHSFKIVLNKKDFVKNLFKVNEKNLEYLEFEYDNIYIANSK